MSIEMAGAYNNFLKKYQSMKKPVQETPQTGLLARKNVKPKVMSNTQDDAFSSIAEYVDFIREQRMKNGKDKNSV
jgi:LPS O-antigen subunit length determinant protein (WzzB/FepE family)